MLVETRSPSYQGVQVSLPQYTAMLLCEAALKPAIAEGTLASTPTKGTRLKNESMANKDVCEAEYPMR